MNLIKVLIVDDHPVVREGILCMLTAEQDLEVVGSAGDGEEALGMVRYLAPDVVLLDLNMPRLNGFEATRLIRETAPSVRVVVLSMHSKEAYIHRAFSAGATGYVLKGTPVGEIPQAIREVHRGNFFICSLLQGSIIKSYLKSCKKADDQEGYDLLSEREQQVFRLIVEGHSTGRIAEQLYVSPKTVEKHRVNLMRKLELNNLVEMIKYAVRVGIIDPDFWKD